jgi:hypothetical protein
MTEAQNAFDLLAEQLREDPDDDVEVTDEGLRVHGALFAFLDGSDLIVCLPEARARDLEARGIARVCRGEVGGGDHWVTVTERELWSELADEAHTFVGEPPVGRQS